MSNYLKIMEDLDCAEPDVQIIIGLIKWVFNGICLVVPVIIIILIILDVTKVAIAGSVDDKMKKEVGQKVASRIIYTIILFLVPSLVNLVFRLVPISDESSYVDCWNGGIKYD